MTVIHTPARRLVEAFGDCSALEAMYTEDVSWRLNHSLAANISGPHAGKTAVCAFNSAVFNKFYELICYFTVFSCNRGVLVLQNKGGTVIGGLSNFRA